MRLRKQILTENDCFKTAKTITPKGVMVHSTGANNPNVSRYVPGDDEIGRNRYDNHWNRTGMTKCVHAFVGKFADGGAGTVQTLPWNWRGWHAGGAANNTHIGFEICEDGLTDASYFSAVYQEAVELTALLCKEFSLDPLADGGGNLPPGGIPAGGGLQPRRCAPLVPQDGQDHGRLPGGRGPGDERGRYRDPGAV